MDMVVRNIDYFRELVKDGKEDVKFDWETEKIQGMREKLLDEVRKCVNVSGK